MSEESQSPGITINIKGPSDLKLSIQISPSSTVLDLKEKIEQETAKENNKIEKERQRLIYSGKVLKDEEALSTYKIQSGHSIHLVKGASKTPSNPSTSSTTTTTAGSTSTTTPAAPSTTTANPSERSGIPSTFAAGLPYANDPLAQLEGLMGHGFGGGSFNPFAGMAGGENLNDPNAMANMLNNPELISQAMSMMTPEMIDQIIASNPALAGMGPQVRQMMQSPMFRQMMQNPEMIRQMMQMSQAAGGYPGLGGLGGPSAANPFATGFGTTPSPATTNPSTTGGTPAANPSTTGGQSPPPNPFAAGAGFGGFNPFALNPAAMQQMQQLFGGAGAGAGAGGFGGFGAPTAGAGLGGASPLPADTRPLEERFSSQLSQLNEMGLVDPQQNLRALSLTGGNVEAAIELIFAGRVPPS